MEAQRTDEWFAKRLGKITGSAFGEVMNLTAKGEPGAGRKNLIVKLAIERLTGKTIDGYQNAAMRRGIELEPFARAAYEAQTGFWVDESTLSSTRSTNSSAFHLMDWSAMTV
jgi:hypothetical protein